MIDSKIGIDSTEITNVEILDIDMNKLLAESYKGIKNKIKDIGGYVYVQQKEVPEVKIIDNLFFGELIIKKGYVPDGKMRYAPEKIYTCMTVNAGHILPDNRNNVSVMKYKKYIKEILCWYVLERYGIKADFANVKVQKIEINVNIPLNEPFAAYSRIMKLFVNNVPGRGTIDDIKTNAEDVPTTHAKRNNTSEIVFYDKKQSIDLKYNTLLKCETAKNKWEMKKKILQNCMYKSDFFSEKIETKTEECMRIELRMYNRGKNKKRGSSQYKIEKFLEIDDAKIDYISDEVIEIKFKEYLRKTILISFCCWYKKVKKEIRKLVIEYKATYGQSWQQYFYPTLYKLEIQHGVLYIIDFIHLRDCLNFCSKKDGINLKHNLTAIMQGLIRKEVANKEWDAFMKNDSVKIIEIFEKLNLEYKSEFEQYDVNLFPRQARKSKKMVNKGNTRKNDELRRN